MNEKLERKLLNKAAGLIARRAFSRGEMRLKLLKFAESPVVEAVMDTLEQLKLLNDADYAYNFAFYRVSREGWGPAKIRDALMRRHVQPSDITNALDKIHDALGDDFGLSDYLTRYFVKREIPKDPKSTRRLIQHLVRRGYRHGSILKALNRMLPSETMKYFGTGD